MIIMKAVLLALIVSTQHPMCGDIGAQEVVPSPRGCAILDKSRPGHFITYDGISGMPSEVTLRLHNNTSCGIIVETDDTSPTRIRKLPNGGAIFEVVTSPEDGLKIPLHYLTQDRRRWRAPEKAYGWGDSVFTYEVLTGQTAVFVVPLNSFKKRLDVVVPFNYSWEAGTAIGMGVGGVTHRVYFLVEDIPAAVLRRRH